MSPADGSDGPTEGAIAPDEPAVPAALAASWRAAEAELFTAVLSSPALYEDVVSVVGDTVGRLRERGSSSASLLDDETVDAIVRDRLGRATAARFLRPDLVGAAALALRHREVMAEQAAARRATLLAAAHAEGATWVLLEESGALEGDVNAPYRRLEAHADTGVALLVTATPDEDFRSCHHDVEVRHVNVLTGRLGAPADGSPEPVRCGSAAEREALVADWRNTLGRPG
jgi:hypothetical protein